jgi:hypothetical protein
MGAVRTASVTGAGSVLRSVERVTQRQCTRHADERFANVHQRWQIAAMLATLHCRRSLRCLLVAVSRT